MAGVVMSREQRWFAQQMFLPVVSILAMCALMLGWAFSPLILGGY